MIACRSTLPVGQKYPGRMSPLWVLEAGSGFVEPTPNTRHPARPEGDAPFRMHR
jgi:hypothetical protein